MDIVRRFEQVPAASGSGITSLFYKFNSNRPSIAKEKISHLEDVVVYENVGHGIET